MTVENDTKYYDFIIEIASTLRCDAEEALEEWKRFPRDSVCYGELLSYASHLKWFIQLANQFGIDLSEAGLADYDVDRKLLGAPTGESPTDAG